MKLYFATTLSLSLTVSFAEKIRVKHAPDLPGVSNPKGRKIILAQDINYPPYASLGTDLDLTGFGVDFSRSLTSVCKIDVVLVQTQWDQCWGSNKIGVGLLNGDFHGCSTYTNTKGVRNRYLEFTKPILGMTRAAGIITRIENGKPVVDGNSDLLDVMVGDVVGWAPTNDVLSTVTNGCTGLKFSDEISFSDTSALKDGENANDFALNQLLNKDVDVIWIYADQGQKYKKACEESTDQEWDCDMWLQFGETFGYIQTGMFDYMNSGTTLAMSKKGSGLSEILNPCIDKFMKTKSYYSLCKKYEIEEECIANGFFTETGELEVYSKPINELEFDGVEPGMCHSSGYCTCPPKPDRKRLVRRRAA